MITIQCPSCGKMHNAPETALGRKVQCRDCRSAFVAQAKQDVTTTHVVALAPEPATVPIQPGTQPPQSDLEQLARVVEKRAAVPTVEASSLSLVSASAAVKRPLGLVWVVFYWSVSGVVTIVGGLILYIAMSTATGFLGAASRSSRAFRQLELHEAAGAGLLLFELLGLLGLLLFHYGLLLLVASYGLWTFRRWGITLARVLAIIGVVGCFIELIVAMVTRAGIVVDVVGLVTSALILVYLYGRLNLSDLRKYLQPPTVGQGDWKDYE
jgi:hypothetical protein